MTRPRRRTTRSKTRNRRTPRLEGLEERCLLATYSVLNTADAGMGSLRDAIELSNANPGPDEIVFDIRASTVPSLGIPVPGFDPVTQTWTIQLASPLPSITDTLHIDGFSQAHFPVLFRYPNAFSSAVQTVSVTGLPTSGTFNLTTVAPLTVGTTPDFSIDAKSWEVQAALEAILGAGAVEVTGTPTTMLVLNFTGSLTGRDIPELVAAGTFVGGINPTVEVDTFALGGIPNGDATAIQSAPNSSVSLEGYNAKTRVLIEGNGGTGLDVRAAHSVVRGLGLSGFDTAVQVSGAGVEGVLIQGNAIGSAPVYYVDLLVRHQAGQRVSLSAYGVRETGCWRSR